MNPGSTALFDGVRSSRGTLTSLFFPSWLYIEEAENSSSDGTSSFLSTGALVTGSVQPSSSLIMTPSASLADPSPSISTSWSTGLSTCEIVDSVRFRLFFPLSALVSPTNDRQKLSKIDHRAKIIRNRNGVVGGGTLMFDVVGFLLPSLRFRGVGGRFDSLADGGGIDRASFSSVGVKGLVYCREGDNEDDGDADRLDSSVKT